MSCFIEIEKQRGRLKFSCGLDVSLGMMSALLFIVRAL